MDFSATLAEVTTMSVDDRLRLVQAIWDSIEAEQSFPDLTEAQQRDLDRRVAELKASPEIAITWEDIKTHLKRPL